MKRALLALACASCAAADARFTVDEAPALASAPRVPVSVLGVIHNGRFDESYWAALEPALDGALGPTSCELGFSEQLHDEDAALYERVDADTRDYGITKKSLEPFAARAKGKAIVAFTIFGKPPTHAERLSVHAQTTAAGVGVPRRRRGRMNDEQVGSSPDSAMELSMSVYSVERHDLILTMSMHYTGVSTDDAVKQLAAKLKMLLPGATCAGWTWNP